MICNNRFSVIDVLLLLSNVFLKQFVLFNSYYYVLVYDVIKLVVGNLTKNCKFDFNRCDK